MKYRMICRRLVNAQVTVNACLGVGRATLPNTVQCILTSDILMFRQIAADVIDRIPLATNTFWYMETDIMLDKHDKKCTWYFIWFI